VSFFKWFAVSDAIQRAFCPLLLCALLLGCSGKKPTYSVAGKVVHKKDGSPAGAGAFVMFEAAQDPYERSMGKIEPDGSFKLSTDRPDNGAIQGEHRVSIVPMAADGSGMDLTPKLSKTIHPKYFELRTSGLKYTIQPNHRNEFLIEVDPPK
jgi:hypothetical protein